VQQLLFKLSYKTIPLFWPLFLLTIVSIMVWAFRAERKWSSGRPLKAVNWGTIAVLLVALPLLLLLLWGADFAYHDDDTLLEFSVSGRNWPVAIWPSLGRYFPLASQEFNGLAHIAATPTIYYGFIALQLVAFCIILNMALSEIGIHWRILAAALILWVSGSAIVFLEAIYPERNIAFWLLALVLALKRFDESPSRLNILTALIAAQFAMYYKEPVFLIIVTLAVVRLFVLGRGSNRLSWQWLQSRPLEVGLLGLSLVFASQFLLSLGGLIGSGSEVGNSYVANATVGPVQAGLQYLRMDPVLWFFAGGVLVRLVRHRRKADMEPVWDAIALAALIYFGALVALGLGADRYMPPVDLLGALFAVRQVAALVMERPALRGWTVGLAIGVTVVTFMSGAFRVAEHHSVTSGTARLSDFVAEYASSRQEPVRLYFPSSLDWRIMNFASNLRYRHADILDKVRFAGPQDFAEGMCVWYAPYRCEQASKPVPGDLIIHLPDDNDRNDAEGSSRAPLFRYSWLPFEIPGLIGRIFYVEAPLYTGSPMPRRWLEATVELQP
jgi:hypothetical protein